MNVEEDLVSSLEQLSFVFSREYRLAHEYLLAQFVKMPEPLNTIQNFLSAIDGCVSGSFVVKAFFSSDAWEPQDVDIWIPKQTPERRQGLEAFLRACEWNQIQYLCDVDYETHHTRFGAKTLTHPKTSVFLNLIECEVEASELEKHLQQSFDLDGCAIAWRGLCDFTVAMPWSDFLSRRWKFIPTEVQMLNRVSLRERYNPTQQRLFPLMKQRRYRVIASRIRKYTERGFTITNALEVLLLVLEG